MDLTCHSVVPSMTIQVQLKSPDLLGRNRLGRVQLAVEIIQVVGRTRLDE